MEKLLMSKNGPAGNENYRKVMNTVANWMSDRGKGGDAGRWRAEADFPDHHDVHFNRALIRTSTAWSDFKKHTSNPLLVKRKDADEITLDLEQ